MPNDDHDTVPQDGTFPETLRITIQSSESAFDDAVEDAETAQTADELAAAVVSFETIAGFRRLLTDRRLDIIRSLMVEPASSISDLADRLGRSYSVVYEDIDMLAETGIVKFRRVGQAKQPFVPYETVEFDVTIRADRIGDDPEARA